MEEPKESILLQFALIRPLPKDYVQILIHKLRRMQISGKNEKEKFKIKKSDEENIKLKSLFVNI